MVAPWVYPLVSALLTIGGTKLQYDQQNRANNRQIMAEQARRQREADARARQHQLAIAELGRQKGFDQKRQSQIASAVQRGVGGRQADIDKAAAEQAARLRGAVAAESGPGARIGAESGTKGRVSGKLAKRKAKGVAKNKERSDRRAGLRGLVNAYKQQPVDDSKILMALSNQLAMTGARSAASQASARGAIDMAGWLGPDPITTVDPNSTAGAIMIGAGQGIGAYGPYAKGKDDDYFRNTRHGYNIAGNRSPQQTRGV